MKKLSVVRCKVCGKLLEEHEAAIVMGYPVCRSHWIQWAVEKIAGLTSREERYQLQGELC